MMNHTSGHSLILDSCSFFEKKHCLFSHGLRPVLTALLQGSAPQDAASAANAQSFMTLAHAALIIRFHLDMRHLRGSLQSL